MSLALGLCRRRERVSAEIVLVEWLPVNGSSVFEEDVPRMLNKAYWRGDFDCELSKMPLVNIVVVHKEDAARAIGPKATSGMLEWHCKNVGLRRAHGDMLLIINADDMPSPALFDFLAGVKHLRRDTFYLAQNLGVWVAFYVDELVKKGLPFWVLYDNLFSVSRLGKPSNDQVEQFARERRAAAIFSRDHRLCQDPSLLSAARSGELGAFWGDYDARHGVKLNSSSEPGEMPENFFDPFVGDFILASRVAWHRINAAPLPMQSIAIDWMVSCRFTRQQLRQVLLVAPCFVLHQLHPPAMVTQRRRVDKAPKELGDNVGERCRDPFRPFPSERGKKRRDWGFRDLLLHAATIMPRTNGPSHSPFRALYGRYAVPR